MKATLTLTLFNLSILMYGQTLTSIESAEFDPIGHQFLISNQNSIVIVDGTGTPTSSLSIPVGYGMEVVGSNLFAISGNSVICNDINSGNELSSITISGAQFLNGMTSDGMGRVWVTDFGAKKIHEVDFTDLQNPSSNIIVNNTVSTPNGICYDETSNRLVFVSWGNSAPIKAINLDDYSVTTIVANSGVGNIDGIDNDAYGNFYIASWSPNRITQYNNDFTVAQTITVSGGLNSPADIAYAEEIDTLIIPNSGNNTVRFVGFSPTVSVNEKINFKSINVYPNPTTDFVVCEFELPATETIRVALVDNQGKEITNLYNNALPGGKNKLVLDVSAIAKGLYHLHFLGKQIQQSLELIIH
jgi:hypothetical protein